MTENNLLEVLAPVGDMERLYAALDFGADAVYLGGTAFGMRAASASFDAELLKKACDEAHSRGKRVYLTCNTLPHNDEIVHLEQFVNDALAAGVDAMIANDIGVFSLIKKYAPDMEIHVSTQAGIVNYVTANEFYNMGAKRVVLARELSLEEIAEIRAKTPKDLEIVASAHSLAAGDTTLWKKSAPMSFILFLRTKKELISSTPRICVCSTTLISLQRQA